jgi:hypothetical protein
LPDTLEILPLSSEAVKNAVKDEYLQNGYIEWASVRVSFISDKAKGTFRADEHRTVGR